MAQDDDSVPLEELLDVEGLQRLPDAPESPLGARDPLTNGSAIRDRQSVPLPVWEEITDEPAPIEERFIYPFIRPGDMVALVAPGGQGKTSIAAEIALSLATSRLNSMLAGAFTYNREKFGQARVGIIDGDGSKDDWARMFMRLCGPLRLSVEERREAQKRIRFMGYEMAGLHKHDRAYTRALVQSAALGGIDFLVVDPVHKVFNAVDANDMRWVLESISVLRDVARAAGITTLVLIHPGHKKRGPKEVQLAPLGSSQQKGLFDCWLGVEKDDKHGVTRLYKFKDRGTQWIKDGTFVRLHHTGLPNGIAFSKAQGVEEWPHMPPEEVMVELDAKAEEILLAMPVGRFTAQQVEGRDATIREFITYRLEPAGLVRTRERGEGIGQPTFYELTPSGIQLQSRLRERKTT